MIRLVAFTCYSELYGANLAMLELLGDLKALDIESLVIYPQAGPLGRAAAPCGNQRALDALSTLRALGPQRRIHAPKALGECPCKCASLAAQAVPGSATLASVGGYLPWLWGQLHTDEHGSDKYRPRCIGQTRRSSHLAYSGIWRPRLRLLSGFRKSQTQKGFAAQQCRGLCLESRVRTPSTDVLWKRARPHKG